MCPAVVQAAQPSQSSMALKTKNLVVLGDPTWFVLGGVLLHCGGTLVGSTGEVLVRLQLFARNTRLLWLKLEREREDAGRINGARLQLQRKSFVSSPYHGLRHILRAMGALCAGHRAHVDVCAFVVIWW